MRKINIILLSLCLMFVCGCNGQQKQSDIVFTEAAYDITVYITETGECYHTSDCICLNKSKIKKTLSVAVEEYRPCQLCYPPIIDE